MRTVTPMGDAQQGVCEAKPTPVTTSPTSSSDPTIGRLVPKLARAGTKAVCEGLGVGTGVTAAVSVAATIAAKVCGNGGAGKQQPVHDVLVGVAEAGVEAGLKLALEQAVGAPCAYLLRYPFALAADRPELHVTSHRVRVIVPGIAGNEEAAKELRRVLEETGAFDSVKVSHLTGSATMTSAVACLTAERALRCLEDHGYVKPGFNPRRSWDTKAQLALVQGAAISLAMNGLGRAFSALLAGALESVGSITDPS